MSFCDRARMTVSLLLWGSGDDSCPDKDLSTCSSTLEGAEAVIDPGTREWWLQSFYSPLPLIFENTTTLFCFRSLIDLSLIILTCSPRSSSLPSFLLYLFPTTRSKPPQASSLVHKAHPSRQTGQPLVPAVVCVVSVVTGLRLAWREMRPDCACGGQRGVNWVMCLVSD